MDRSAPSGNFLHITWDGAGAALVEAQLFEQLRGRGHHITVLGPASVERHFRRAGCEFVLDRSAPDYDSVTDFLEDDRTWMRDHVWIGQAREHARAVVNRAAEYRPNAILISMPLMGAMAGAEATRLPAVGLGSTIAGGARFGPSDSPGRAFWEAGLDHLNSGRADVGLAPLGSTFEQQDALDRILIMSIAELHDPDVPLDSNTRHVGPPMSAGPQTPPPERPCVLVSSSTSNMAQVPVLQRVLNSLESSGLSGILTLGPAVARDSLRIPPNVEVHDHLPHSEVLPRVSAVVTHAGHGTVMAALAYGVPLLCLPIGRDQPYVAQRVVAAGAGLSIPIDSSPRVISEALARLLADPLYRRAADQLRVSIADSEGTAVAELEELLVRES